MESELLENEVDHNRKPNISVQSASKDLLTCQEI